MKLSLSLLFLCMCLSVAQAEKIRVILDTDANNELDDQHAIAYMLFNGDTFHVEAITVNRTRNGGPVAKHLEEAQRVVDLCGLKGKIKVLTGADGSFEEIKESVAENSFDGSEAVDFIIQQARLKSSSKLVLLPVGKLTNIALALKKAPYIAKKIRIVWLGSNYPLKGEYNQVNDEPSLNYILEQDVPFEIVTVRYGKPSGTDAVRATLDEVREIMPGLGPQVATPVVGRHVKSFNNFGDYSLNLFENIKLHGNPPSRALFDMAAIAIVKDPKWATATTIPAPILKAGQWQDRPNNDRKIVLWENFNGKVIMKDFYQSMKKPVLAGE